MYVTSGGHCRTRAESWARAMHQTPTAYVPKTKALAPLQATGQPPRAGSGSGIGDRWRVADGTLGAPAFGLAPLNYCDECLNDVGVELRAGTTPELG